MNTLSTTTPSSATGPREDWLRAGVLAGFLATFAMTVVLVGAYWLAAALGDANGSTLQQWCWALVHNPVADRTVDGVVLAIGANLAMGFCSHWSTPASSSPCGAVLTGGRGCASRSFSGSSR